MEQVFLKLLPLLFYQFIVSESISHLSKSPLEKRIIGGETASPEEFLHHVGLFKKTSIGFGSILKLDYRCGGSIIEKMWVLTAAHCLFKSDQATLISPGDLCAKILPKTTAWSKYNYYKQCVGVESLIPHKGYSKMGKLNDIALIKLNTRGYYDNHFYHDEVRAYLPESWEFFTEGWVVGLGLQDPQGIISPRRLKKTHLQIFRYDKCKRIFGSKLIHEGKLCAYKSRRDRFTPICLGDSGSGLVKKIHDRWTIFGIASFTIIGCVTWGPTGFTNVSHYTKWIKGHIYKKIK